MNIITKVLNGSENARSKDLYAFNRWYKGEIDTEECMQEFFRNNRVRFDVQDRITPEMFTEWLKGLGYEPIGG